MSVLAYGTRSLDNSCEITTACDYGKIISTDGMIFRSVSCFYTVKKILVQGNPDIHQKKSRHFCLLGYWLIEVDIQLLIYKLLRIVLSCKFFAGCFFDHFVPAIAGTGFKYLFFKIITHFRFAEITLSEIG